MRGLIAGARDAELYRYGVHAPEFWVNATVAPGTYDLRLKFAERRDPSDPRRCPMNIAINGQAAIGGLDVAARAGGVQRALDLDLPGIAPRNGVIEIRFTGTGGGEAFVQAIEILPRAHRQ